MRRTFTEREALRLFQGGMTVSDAAAAVGVTPADVAAWVARSGPYRAPQVPGRLPSPRGPADVELRRRCSRYFEALEDRVRQAEIEDLEAESDACAHEASRLDAAGCPSDAITMRARILSMARRIESLTAIDTTNE